MNIRKKLKYPPYYYLVSIKIASKEYELCGEEAKKTANYLRQNLSNDSIVLGPTTANVFKINNVYRFQIIIKYRFDKKLMKTLQELDTIYQMNKKVRLEFDINPLRI